jgi:hypothetical protein
MKRLRRIVAVADYERLLELCGNPPICSWCGRGQAVWLTTKSGLCVRCKKLWGSRRQLRRKVIPS